MLRIVILFVCFLCQPLLAMHRPVSQKGLGVKTFEYMDEARHRPVVVEFWYPTDQMEPITASSPEELWVHPKEVRNAPFLKGAPKRPLILVSHGHRGGRREVSWLVESLVQAGYIVAAVDHYGDMRFHFDLIASVRFWDRPLDFTFLLDQLSKDERIREQIDFNSIGFVGYSLGGMTALALAGGKAQDVKEALLRINRYSLNQGAIDKFDLSPSEKSYADPRIKAFFLLCPAVFVYPPRTLKEIKSPVAIVAAMGDEVLPYQEHALRIIQNAPVKKMKVLSQGVSHYTFMNRVTEAGRNILHKAFHTDPFGCDRIAIHREVSAFAVDFFRETLKK